MRTVRPSDLFRPILASLFLFPGILTPADGTAAQWNLDGNVICSARGPASVAGIASDGAGGAIVVWQDQRGTDSNIYAQRFDRSGATLWTADGVAVCTAINEQQRPVIAADGFGGAVIAWDDTRNGAEDVFVQRVNAAGVPQWTANGVGVSLATNVQFAPAIVADGLGGAIVAWNDLRSGTSWDLYASHVTAAGVREWTANGLPISVQPGSQLSASLAPDGTGGAIIVWQDTRTGAYDVYGQRVSITGVVQWTANGLLLVGAVDDQWNVRAIPDGSGGVFVAWQDERTEGTTSDIYVGRFTSAGAALWGSGIGAGTATSQQQNPSIVTDGAGGVIVAWEDFRTGIDFDIYAQRLTATGTPLWTSQGLPVCLAAGHQSTVSAVSDGTGGAAIIWGDDRNGNGDVYARAVDASGSSAWMTDGMPVCTANLSQRFIVAASDGAGGVLAAWTDDRSGNSLVYAQRAELRYGYWGYPEPKVTSATDNPGDQGGKVILRWAASQRDRWDMPAISHYSIWRSTDFVAMASAAGTGDEITRVSTPLEVDAGFSGSAIWETAGANGPEYWEWIANQAAAYQPSYSLTAPTRQDAANGVPAPHYFKVVAHEYDFPQTRAWESATVTAESIDNLAPPAPIQLTGTRGESGSVQLAWKSDATIPDLAHFSVYRSGPGGVTPTRPFFLSNSDAPSYLDMGAPSGPLHYVVTASDVHANESLPSNVVALFGATDVGGDTPPLTVLTVLQNRPNPFTGSTELQIGLPATGDISVEIYDVAGRRVRTLAVKGARAGWQNVSFSGRDDTGQSLASGVYFYRVSANGTTVTNKMVIAR